MVSETSDKGQDNELYPYGHIYLYPYVLYTYGTVDYWDRERTLANSDGTMDIHYCYNFFKNAAKSLAAVGSRNAIVR